jgi:Uri superfamily endonuclease
MLPASAIPQESAMCTHFIHLMALLAQATRTYAYSVLWNGLKGMMTRVAQHLDLEERKRWNDRRRN